MHVDFIPRSQLVQHIEAGWSLIPGYEYNADDYAILLTLSPDARQPLPETVEEISRRFICEDARQLIAIMAEPEKRKKNRGYSKLISLAKYKEVTGLDWTTPQPTEKPIKYCMAMGCYEGNYARGYCNKHYKRLRANGDVEHVRKIRKSCTIEGCGAQHRAHGYCSKHAWRFYQHGDPNVLSAGQRKRDASGRFQA